jgi:spore maturation protein CgeB
MEKCRFLFNKGQKHDINLRIFESMAMGVPLICDQDERSGIDLLFKPWVHYIPYSSKETLEQVMEICMSGFEAQNIVDAAEKEVLSKHLVKHRVQKILEVCDA